MAPTSRPDQLSEEMIDATLADSFPASDPPSWTLGRDRNEPEEIAVVAVIQRSTINNKENFIMKTNIDLSEEHIPCSVKSSIRSPNAGALSTVGHSAP